MEKDRPPDTAVTSVEENSATTESKTTPGDVTTTPTRDEHARGDTNNTTSNNKSADVDTPFSEKSIDHNNNDIDHRADMTPETLKMPMPPTTPPTPVSPISTKFRLLQQQYKQRYNDCKKEKEGLKAKNEELLKKLEEINQRMPQVATTATKCGDHCIEDDDEHKLKCYQCKKLFHYACSSLPLYQLTHFLTIGYRRYLCRNCTIVPDYLKDIDFNIGYTPINAPDVQTPEMSNDRLTTLQHSEAALRNLLDEREKEIDLLQHKIDEKEKHSSEVNIVNENTESLQGQINNLNEKLKLKEADLSRALIEATRYQNEGRKLKETITALQKESEGQESRMRTQGAMIQTLNNKCKENSTAQKDSVRNKDLMGIDAKLEAFSVGILSKVTEIIEQKLGKPNTDTDSDPTETGGNQKTFAKALESPRHIKEAIREAKNDDKIEESEAEKRARNIIIHGAEEIGTTSEEMKEEDDGYVKSILKKLGISNAPASVSRLGKPNDRKRRPIKLVMKSKQDKTKVLNNLSKLKGTEEDLGKISITDDYTQTEREEIKRWVMKAKEKTAQDPDKVYKVRGDPKNGLKLIWFAKNQ